MLRTRQETTRRLGRRSTRGAPLSAAPLRLSLALLAAAALLGCAVDDPGDGTPEDGMTGDGMPRDGTDPIDGPAADATDVVDTPDGMSPLDAMPPPDAMTPPDAAPDAMPPPADPPGPGEAPRFAFPIALDDRMRIHRGLFFGVDHDPAEGEATQCLAYDGRPFPFCYDGHQGSDFVLSGGFDAMDTGSAVVVAAAGGEVVSVVDGNYDRCRGNLEQFEPSCDGHPIRSNTVVIAHPNGWRTRYLHLMRGSIGVQVGDRVDCGAPLARLGSSGRSYTPHLHFEVVDPTGASVDPFAGEVSGPRSLWGEQRADDRLPGAACDPAWGPAR